MESAQHYDGMETRQRLLEVACELFAEIGYKQTTLVQICDRARANKASVNYHFRSKEGLYQECWRLAIRRANEAYPPEGGVATDAPAEERLRGRIHSILARMADPTLREFQLVIGELVNPTGLLAAVLHESLEPIHAGFVTLMDELLSSKTTMIPRELCLRSIMGQCMDMMALEQRRKAAPAQTGDLGPPSLNVDLEVLTDHITRFSLAGIRETRKYLETTAGASETKSV
jgi:AcrR family transcriptional regulator